MIRSILFGLAIMITAGLSAQNAGLPMGEEFEAKAPTADFYKQGKAKKGSAWFNMFEEMTTLSSDWSSFLDYLFPDSTAQWVGTNGGVYVWKCAQGQVLDPTSGLFVFNSKPISKAATYTLDSIAFYYAYRRTQNTNADTLLIQVIKPNAMGYVPLPNWTTPRSYCRPDYDSIQRKAIDATYEIKIPLTIQDTAVGFARLLQIPVNISLDSNEEVAVTVHYIPGNPWNTGDTLSRTISGPGIINNFAMYNGRDGNRTDDNGYYNHNLMITKDISHNVSPNGWNGRYIPGVAWNSGTYHTSIYFKITYDDFTGISNPSLYENFDIYPNPAVDYMNIEYSMQDAKNGQVVLTDILGHKILETSFSNSNGVERLDVSNLKRGLYFATLKVDGKIAATKRVVLGN